MVLKPSIHTELATLDLTMRILIAEGHLNLVLFSNYSDYSLMNIEKILIT